MSSADALELDVSRTRSQDLRVIRKPSKKKLSQRLLQNGENGNSTIVSTAPSSAFSTVQSSAVDESTSTSADILGNRGKAKKRAALLTRVRSYIFTLANIVFILVLVQYLLRGFAFQTGHYDEVAYKIKNMKFKGNHTLHPEEDVVTLQLFRNPEDIGTYFWFYSSEIRIAQVDSGMSHFVGVHTEDMLLFLSSHGCFGVAKSTEGLLGLHCDVDYVQNPINCTQVCVESNSDYGMIESELQYDINFTVQELYKTQNSLGFGVVSVEEHLVGVSKLATDNETYQMKLELRAHSRSNAQDTYGIPWQDILVYLFAFDLCMNVFARLMTTPVLLNGVKIRKTKVLVKADLAGGLFTSPGRYFSMFLLTIVFGAQNYVFLDAGHYPHSMVSHVWSIAGITSMSGMLLTILMTGTEYRFFTTGTMLFFLAGFARAILLQLVMDNAQTSVRKIGQVLERDCTLFDEEHMHLSEIRCNVADSVGMSGLEVSYKIFFEPVVVTILLVFALEIIVILFHISWFCIKKRGKVNPSTMSHSSGTMSINSRHRYRVSAQSTIQGVSDYDKCVLLSNLGHSHFSRQWASPINTVLGKFTHASTSIEDDLVMYGPVLIKMNYFPYAAISGRILGKRETVEWIIRNKFYVGVLASNGKLASKRENGIKVSNYISEYKFDEMPYLLSGEPLQ